jgi:hypothetical protein
MPTESIKTKTKDSFVRVSQEDKKELGPRSKDGLHKLIVKFKVQEAKIKELETKYAQSEAKVAQLSLQIENSKLGNQPNLEDLSFDSNIIDCNFAMLNPFGKAPLNYRCVNPIPLLDPFSNRVITTTFCKTCNAYREALVNEMSDDSIYKKAVKIAGRKNIPMIVALHNENQTLIRDNEDYKKFQDSYKERTAEAFAISDRDMLLLKNKMKEQGKINQTQKAEITARCKTVESENGNLKNQVKTLESRLSEMNNHDAEFETLKLENANLKETIGIQEDLDHVKTHLKETEEQMTQTQSRLSEITDLETIVQAIRKYPDWLTRFQTIGEINELRGKLGTAENTVTFLKIQQKSNNQAINTLEARNEALSTVEKTLEYDLTSLKNKMLLTHEIIMGVNKYFTLKQAWASRIHVDMPENYDKLPEAIRLTTEICRKLASFIQQIQEEKQL